MVLSINLFSVYQVLSNLSLASVVEQEQQHPPLSDGILQHLEQINHL